MAYVKVLENEKYVEDLLAPAFIIDLEAIHPWKAYIHNQLFFHKESKRSCELNNF